MSKEKLRTKLNEERIEKLYDELLDLEICSEALRICILHSEENTGWGVENSYLIGKVRKKIMKMMNLFDSEAD